MLAIRLTTQYTYAISKFKRAHNNIMLIINWRYTTKAAKNRKCDLKAEYI